MITIKEIAQQAGFSPSTVSRLLSNDPSLSVSPETILDYWNRRIRRYIF